MSAKPTEPPESAPPFETKARHHQMTRMAERAKDPVVALMIKGGLGLLYTVLIFVGSLVLSGLQNRADGVVSETPIVKTLIGKQVETSGKIELANTRIDDVNKRSWETVAALRQAKDDARSAREDSDKRMAALENTLVRVADSLATVADNQKKTSENQTRASDQQAKNSAALAVLTDHMTGVDKTLERHEQAIQSSRH